MILILLAILLVYFAKLLKTHSKKEKKLTLVILVIYIGAMFLYENYIKTKLGWEFGIPYDDDTGWIFKAATALHEGMPIHKLYTLALSADYDAANRAFSFNNIGQYIYMCGVSLVLYVPKIISVQVNLFLLYILQGLMAMCAGIRITDAIKKDLYNTQRKIFYSWGFIFVAFILCPIIQFNSYKLLRETLFYFVLCHAAAACMEKKKKSAIIFGIVSVGLRPIIAVFLIPLYAYYLWSKKLGNIINITFSGMMLIGTLIVHKIAQMIGWSYFLGSVSFSEMIHLFLFPNIISQTQNMLVLGQNPSWVTILYFFQALWNVIYVVVFFAGIFGMKKKKTNYFFWLLLWLNCLMIYTVPYSVETITPRYKIIYLIPMLYFIGGSMVRFKFGKRRTELIR